MCFRLKRSENQNKSYLIKFLRWSQIISIPKSNRTIVFIFIVMFTTFRPVCPSVFFRCFMSNCGKTRSATDWDIWLKSASKWNHLEVTGSIPTTNKLQGIITIAQHLHPVMVKGIRTIYLVELNKGFRSKFRVCSRARHKTPEGRRTHRPKRCEYNIEDEDNSPNTINYNKSYW